MSQRSDRQRELARQALKAEAQCLQALNHIPSAQSILDTPQLRRAQTRGLMVERIPDALAVAEVAVRSDPSLRTYLVTARASWSDAEGLRWQMVGEVEGLIRQRAGKIARTSRLEIEDLVQEGRLGALRAARRYDPEAQNFTTYAQWWIRAAMTRSVDVEGRLVRLPGGLVEQQRQLNRIIVDIVASGESVTDERLSKLSGIHKLLKDHLEQIAHRLRVVHAAHDRSARGLRRDDGSAFCRRLRRLRWRWLLLVRAERRHRGCFVE